MKIEYLVFDLIILFSSIFGLAVYRQALKPKIYPALYAVLVVSTIFLGWDVLVTNYWWSFNPSYVLGVNLINLPIEEVLFFGVVSWSCLVIWENLRTKINGDYRLNIELLLIVLSVLFGGFFLSNKLWYSVTVCALSFLIAILSLLFKKFLRRKVVLIFLTLVVCLTVVFNGYLTARPVVVYSSKIMTNWRLFTIPFEDILYGMGMITGLIMFYEQKRTTK